MNHTGHTHVSVPSPYPLPKGEGLGVRGEGRGEGVLRREEAEFLRARREGRSGEGLLPGGC